VTARAEVSRPERPAPPRPGPLVQYALLAGPLLSMLDSSIVNVAVEPIARELHASLITVQWTVSGGLIAALYATHARAHGPVAALHLAGVVLALIAAAGMLAALALPAVRNTALARD